MTATQRWTLTAAILGSSIVFLDGTIVAVALQRLGEDLPASIVGVLEGQTYVTSGYLATLAALLILAGALADYYGRRRIFTIGLVGFGITSVLCGLAPTLELLAIFRVLQGATGALLVPGSLSIITATFEGPARSRAFGIWAAATSATTMVGPVVGGVLVDAISWRAAFLINIPLVAVALWATVRHMPETRDEEASGRFDWLGAVVVAVAVGGLSFGAIRGQEKQWQDAAAFVALGVGAVSAVLFPILMARRPHPLVPLSLFRIRDFAVINLSTLLIYGALYTTFGFQSLFLQGTIGYTALAAGLVGLPTSILLTVLSTRVGEFAGRNRRTSVPDGRSAHHGGGPRVVGPHSASSEPWAANLAAPGTLVPPASTFVDVLPAVVLFGVGIALVVAPLTSALMASIPVRNAGLGSAINNAVSRVGQPLLAAVIFIVITGSYFGSLGQRVPGIDPTSAEIRRAVPPLNQPAPGVDPELAEAARVASTEAYHLAMVVGAVLLIAGAATNYVGLRPRTTVEGRTAERTAASGSPPGPPAG